MNLVKILSIVVCVIIGSFETAAAQLMNPGCTCVTATLRGGDIQNSCPIPTAQQEWTICDNDFILQASGKCCYVTPIQGGSPVLVSHCPPIIEFESSSDVQKYQDGDCCYGKVWMTPQDCTAFELCRTLSPSVRFKLCPDCCPGLQEATEPDEDDEQPQIPGDNNCGPQEIGCGSPILLSERGNHLELTNLDGGVRFDLDADGFAERVSWTTARSDDAFLALDRNGNGAIDNGLELFGNFTPQPPTPDPNGFHALSALDANGDGWITAADPIFEALLFWTDTSHDGISQADELTPVVKTWITGFCLGYHESRRIDRYGNLFRYISIATYDRSVRAARRKLAVDVFFLRDATHE